MLKAPGIKLLKLKNDKPLSKFSFKINLRRYNTVKHEMYRHLSIELPPADADSNVPVRRCRLTLSDPR
jgi:hypothetical protein